MWTDFKWSLAGVLLNVSIFGLIYFITIGFGISSTALLSYKTNNITTGECLVTSCKYISCNLNNFFVGCIFPGVIVDIGFIFIMFCIYFLINIYQSLFN
jgi:hypothetical protein